jgi:hypothetical protein
MSFSTFGGRRIGMNKPWGSARLTVSIEAEPFLAKLGFTSTPKCFVRATSQNDNHPRQPSRASVRFQRLPLSRVFRGGEVQGVGQNHNPPR